MNITKEGWAKIIGAVLLAIMTIAGVLLGVDVQLQNAQQTGPVVGSQAITERINLDSFGDNKISNGGDLTFYSGNRTGQTIKLTGDTGAIDATTLTVSSLISQVVSFSGEDGNITDTLLVQSLTVTGTGTIAHVSATDVTGTLITAAQPNVTSVGDLTSLSVGGGYASTGCDVLATGVLNCAGAANIGGAVNITGTISKAGVSFTGVAKWGTASSYTSGSSISHGFATTPTMCILQPARDVTSTLTITTTGFSSDMATVATPIYWMCGQ